MPPSRSGDPFGTSRTGSLPACPLNPNLDHPSFEIRGIPRPRTTRQLSLLFLRSWHGISARMPETCTVSARGLRLKEPGCKKDVHRTDSAEGRERREESATRMEDEEGEVAGTLRQRAPWICDTEWGSLKADNIRCVNTKSKNECNNNDNNNIIHKYYHGHHCIYSHSTEHMVHDRKLYISTNK